MPKSDGYFKKGQVANPTGRPKDVYKLAELCRVQTPLVLETLIGILTNGAQKKDKIRVCEILLARGYGQPIQGVNITGSVEHKVQPVINITIGDATTTIEPEPASETRALPAVESD